MSFHDILRAGIRDFAEHGFDTQERLEYWADMIRRAAKDSLVPQSQMEQAVRNSLARIYQSMVEREGVLKFHNGVSRFTLQKIKPQLRAELDRRIMASANLIKLNREVMVDKTVQRFQGWATSIPAGGSKAIDKQEEAARIKKALASQTFEQRRVAIDQGHKLSAAINEIVAVDGGALAAIWHSRWRAPGYDYRYDHKERDQHVYAVKGNWAISKGLMKPGQDGYTDDITRPSEEPFCFPGDSRIPFADSVEKAFRRWYEGELTEIITDSGISLRGTPNHPILTSKGWRAIGSLKEGDDVIEVSDKLFDPLKHNKDNTIPLISEIFSAVSESGVSKMVRGKLEQFHGDGSVNCHVDIVDSACPLSFGIKPSQFHGRDSFILAMPFVGFARRASIGSICFLAKRCGCIFARFMGALRNCAAILFGGILEPNRLGIAHAASHHSLTNKAINNCLTSNSEASCNSLNGFSSNVRFANFICGKFHSLWSALKMSANIKPATIDTIPKNTDIDADDLCDFRHRLPFATKATHVVKVNRSWFSGHVYNLQTRNNWYVANNIISHNCQCHYQYLYNLRDLEKYDMLTIKGIESLAEARRKIAS